ncbi:MAG: SHOCT domain-containing protein [Spirochaetota bacterium]
MKRITTLITLLILTLPVALMARWRGDGYGFGCDLGFNRYFGFGGGIMMITGIIILALLIFLAIKMINGGNSNPFKTQDPLNILKSRYAKGEISKEQFNEMKREI